MQDTVVVYNPQSPSAFVAVAIYANYHAECGARGIMKAHAYPYTHVPLVEATHRFRFLVVACDAVMSDDLKDAITAHAGDAENTVYLYSATGMCTYLGIPPPYHALVDRVDTEYPQMQMSDLPDNLVDLRIALGKEPHTPHARSSAAKSTRGSVKTNK